LRVQNLYLHYAVDNSGERSLEQLQSLSKAARILGKGMEEVTRDVTNYMKQLQDLLPKALEAATR
jgi:hypothetical protein